MKRWLILAALVVAISATASVAVHYLPTVRSSSDTVLFPAPPKPTGPVAKVVIEGEPKINFGIKPQHTEIAHEWVIANNGDADLRLYNPSTTCSCTVANFQGGKSEITLKPHESTTIHLTFNTKQWDGKYDQHATISTTDPAHPTIELGAIAEVHPALIFTPPDMTIPFMKIANDTEHHYRAALSSPDKPDFKVERAVSSRPDKIEVTATPLSDEERAHLKFKQGGYRIDITIKPGMPLGPFRDEIIIDTNHPNQPRSQLTVMGTMVGPINHVPEHLRMVNVSGKEGAKANVMLLVRGLRPTKFEIVRKPPLTEVSVDPDGKDGKYRLTVTVPPGTKPAEIDDMVVLKTDHPLDETVQVPVTLYIRN